MYVLKKRLFAWFDMILTYKHHTRPLDTFDHMPSVSEARLEQMKQEMPDKAFSYNSSMT